MRLRIPDLGAESVACTLPRCVHAIGAILVDIMSLEGLHRATAFHLQGL